MPKTNTIITERYTMGDAVADGLMSGVIAGLAMGVYILLIFLINNIPIDDVLAYFSNKTTSPFTGVFMHLAISGIYGALFVFLCSLFKRNWEFSPSNWLIHLLGLLYGFFLWLVAIFILNREILPVENILGFHFLISHLIFGLILGMATHLKELSE